MLKLVKYDLKKHLRLVLVLCSLLFALFLLDSFRTPFYSGDVTNKFIDNIMNVYYSFITMLRWGTIIGFLIFIGYDFIQNLLSDEKNFLFSIPLSTSEFFLSKIISTTILTGILYSTLGVVSFLNNIMFKDSALSEGNLSINYWKIFWESFGLKSLPTIFTYCLVALMILYFIVLVFKKALENTRFKFLWLLPFTLIFITYYVLTFPNDLNVYTGNMTGGQLKIVIINLIVAMILFAANSCMLKNKTDI